MKKKLVWYVNFVCSEQMASNDLRHTVESSLKQMKYDFSQNELRYATLDEIAEQNQDEIEKKSSYWRFEFYQKYFDVNTTDVLYR